MTLNRHQQGFSHSQILKFGLLVLSVGMVLFLFVWWPIQAERASLRLSEWQAQLAQKKAELNALKARYEALTSLHQLDKWASAHGPWRTPQANDIIIIPS